MARAARTAAVIVVLLVTAALVPPTAGAAVVGTTDLSVPAQVTVGETFTATLTLTNANTDAEELTANTVCDGDDPEPCFGLGIRVQPACGRLSGLDACSPGHEEPSVFGASATALGVAGTACADTTFSVAEDPQTGELHVAPPAEVVVTLPASGSRCAIDLTLTATAMPVADADPLVDGVQTTQIATSRQVGGLADSTSFATALVTVRRAQPSISTSASGGLALGTGALSDRATVSGRAFPVAGATVAFRLYGPDDATCSGAPVFAPAAVPIAADGSATSPAFAPAQPGTYRWIASYSGDANNAPVSGACDDPGETVVVGPAAAPAPGAPSVVVAASPGVLLGGQVSAVAVVSGRSSPAPGATVLFRLHPPDASTCAGTPAFAATVVLGADGSAQSPPVAPSLLPGTYRWSASYSGDANNAPATSACGAPGSTVTVAPLPPRVLSAAFASQPRVGQPAILTVAAYDPLRPIAGLQVSFGEPRGTSGASACRLAGFDVALSPLRLRLPYTFTRSGRHTITIVVLSGGCAAPLTRTSTTIVVDVAEGGAARAAHAAAPRRDLAARAARAAACGDRFRRPAASAASRRKVAAAILCLVNVERAQRGMVRLERSSVLARVATGHSRDMLRRRYFAHAGPGGPSLRARLRRLRYRGASAAENIGYGGRSNAKRMVQAWMSSPPHRANILSPRSRFAGVGIAIGVPVAPGRPGSISTMSFGSAQK